MQKLSTNSPALIFGLILIDSLHFIFARLMLPYLPPVMTAFLALTVAAIEMGIVVQVKKGISPAFFKRHWKFFVAIGALVAVASNLSYMAVVFVEPGTAALLGQTTVLFGVLLGLLWLKEKLTLLQLGGSAVALAGVAAISFQPGDYFRVGSLVVLAASFIYAIHAAVVKRYRIDMDFYEFFLFRAALTALFLFFLAVGQNKLVMPTPQGLLWVTMVGTIEIFLGRSLYYVVLNRVKMSMHAILLTLSPMMTMIWALLLFGSAPTRTEIIGGAAVIAGITLVAVKRLRPLKPEPAGSIK